MASLCGNRVDPGKVHRGLGFASNPHGVVSPSQGLGVEQGANQYPAAKNDAVLHRVAQCVSCSNCCGKNASSSMGFGHFDAGGREPIAGLSISKIILCEVTRFPVSPFDQDAVRAHGDKLRASLFHRPVIHESFSYECFCLGKIRGCQIGTWEEGGTKGVDIPTLPQEGAA